MKKEVIIIGYSGHAFVVCDIFLSMGWKISGYCDKKAKNNNPYKLKYLGRETDAKILKLFMNTFCFVAIGDNKVREQVYDFLVKRKCTIANAVHPCSIISAQSTIGNGVMIAPNVVINSNSVIKNGVVCNTSSVIEHDCTVEKFAHIAPGAVLCGNVTIGEKTLVGANAVVKPGIKIGNEVTIGIGTAVIKNIESGKTFAGKPQREL